MSWPAIGRESTDWEEFIESIPVIGIAILSIGQAAARAMTWPLNASSTAITTMTDLRRIMDEV